MIQWHALDTWMTAIGALAGAACAVVGSLLLLRRMSMMADALSHAVLPGLVIAYLVAGSRGSVAMAVGAIIAALAAVVLVAWLSGTARVDRGAALGVVLTTLFALGLLLAVRLADRVDLDPGCVLYGSLETAAFRRVRILGFEIPPAVLALGAVLLLNITVVAVLLKEFRLAIFDPEGADTLGIGSKRMHMLLMVLVALTVVACFEAVGSILPIAMIVAPAAAARLLTDRLVPMLCVAVILAVIAAPLGHLGAVGVTPLLGLGETVTSGAMTVAATLIFVAVWLASLRTRSTDVRRGASGRTAADALPHGT